MGRRARMRRWPVAVGVLLAGCGARPAPAAVVAALTVSPRGTGSCPAGMVLIPSGMFWMGSPDGEGEADQHPQHRVTVTSFCMDRTEVTVEAYTACVRSGGCRAAPTTVNFEGANHRLQDPWCNGSRSDRGSHPINCVDWQMAADYCRAQGNRLPTESEWEYGARGSEGRAYPWGNEAPGPTRLNACGSECVALGRANGQTWTGMYPDDDGAATTAPVGSDPGGDSPFGLHDMAGNVWEWTSDWYGPYSEQGAPGSGQFRVYRGGSWCDIDAAWVRAARRDWVVPTFRYTVLGFRCARGAR